MAARIALVCLLAATGCTTRNPAFCDAETECENGLQCNELTSTCPLDCVLDSDCDDPAAPICAADTSCRGCDDNEECVARDPAVPVCADGACTGCTVDADCTSFMAPICDTGSGQCVGCASSAECLAKFPGEREVCDTDSGSCVECVMAGQFDGSCAAAEPICGDDGLCRGCRVNTECPSQVCLDDGTCASLEQMIRVSQASGNAAVDCGIETASPCDDLNLGVLRTINTGRPIVRVDDGDHRVLFEVAGLNLRIVSPVPGGATYRIESDPPSGGAGINVTGNANLIVDGLRIIYDVSIAPVFPGVQCLGQSGASISIRRSFIEGWLDGVSVDGCAKLEITGSTIVNQKRSGVLLINTDAVITSNVISYNGTDSQGEGGIVLTQNTQTTELSFNTVVDNLVRSGPTTAGIVCTGDVMAHSNIVYGNDPQLGNRLVAQVNGGCTHTFSAIEGVANGGADMNIGDDPMFEDDEEDRDAQQKASGFDLHLRPGSPCIDRADPNAPEPFDVDGDIRPAGAASDIGADEAG